MEDDVQSHGDGGQLVSSELHDGGTNAGEFGRSSGGFDSVGPGAGAYVNEAGPFQPKYHEVFWGGKLSAIVGD
jgi:hypothetical protein